MKKNSLSSTPKFLVHRPDAVQLQAYLDDAGETLPALVIRMAWELGLLRSEIHDLTWEQVHFEQANVQLPDREIPMPPDFRRFLMSIRLRHGNASGFVVRADRGGHQPTEQHLSYICRQALNQCGQTEVRLLDLRYDFIIRQLQQRTWQEVSRISGVDVRTLKLHFSKEAQQPITTRVEVAGRYGKSVDDVALGRLLETEGDSLGGVAVRLAWEAGLYQQELLELRWDMVDWSENRLCLPERTVPLPSSVREMLLRLQQRDAAWKKPQILLSPRSHSPLNGPYLSRCVRLTLVRYGMDQCTLRDLRRDYEMSLHCEQPILAYVAEHGSIHRTAAMELLGLTAAQANARLRGMVIRGTLVLVGYEYYAPQDVVTPDNQEETILASLANHGFCHRRDIAELLRLPPQRTGRILQRLVERGVIERVGRRYRLPEPATAEEEKEMQTVG